MRAGQGKWLVSFVLWIMSLSTLGQEISVHGGFVEDSLLIGQDISYYVTASYPLELEMVFPDSSYDFSPFEYSRKMYFPTEVRSGMAFDSTVYAIQSYEIDLVQYLQVATIILNGEDSTVIRTPLDSIYLTELAPIVSDTTQLIANLDYREVNRFFNYPLLYYILGGTGLLVLILSLVFGKRVLRFFRLRRLKKEYELFASQLNAFIRNLKQDPNPELAELALNSWKKYQEKLDKYPYTKLTTREILSESDHKELDKPLHAIDRLIYGRRGTPTIYQDFQQIEDFTQHRYLKKVEDIKHGQ